MHEFTSIRKVDELGRVITPQHIRREMGIQEKDKLDIYYIADANKIVLRPEGAQPPVVGKYINARRVDDLGRIVLPIDTRRQMGIGENTKLDIYCDVAQKEFLLMIHPNLLGRIVASIRRFTYKYT